MQRSTPEDRYPLLTPENVQLAYELAGIGSRFVAAVVDGLIQTVLLVAAVIATLTLTGLAQALLDLARVPEESLTFWILAGGLLLSFLILWGYYLFFEVLWSGQSPGKRIMGLRVIKDTGYPVAFSDAAIRNLVRVVDFLPVYYGFGVAAMLLNRRAKRLGDIAAGTVVVKDRSRVALDSLEERWRAAPLASPNLARLTAEEWGLVREFLLRREGLPAPQRTALAARLAQKLCTRIEFPQDELNDEAFLEALAAAGPSLQH